jgi:hypothetical protein
MIIEASSHKSEIKIETLCELQNNRMSNMQHASALDKDIEKIRHLLPKEEQWKFCGKVVSHLKRRAEHKEKHERSHPKQVEAELMEIKELLKIC